MTRLMTHLFPKQYYQDKFKQVTEHPVFCLKKLRVVIESKSAPLLMASPDQSDLDPSDEGFVIDRDRDSRVTPDGSALFPTATSRKSESRLLVPVPLNRLRYLIYHEIRREDQSTRNESRLKHHKPLIPDLSKATE